MIAIKEHQTITIAKFIQGRHIRKVYRIPRVEYCILFMIETILANEDH